MNLYAVYIHDARYSAPNFYVETFVDDDGAREHALKRLSSSVHYRAVEVFEGDRLVCVVQKDKLDAAG